MLLKQKDKYPRLEIRNKNGLAKRISSEKFSKEKALDLINDVLENHDRFWGDVDSASEPEKAKYVRSCKGTKLGKLLSKIDKKILKPQDELVPDFIFGGLSERDHVKAVCFLLGKQRKRTLLKLDISKFFEQIKYQDVYDFFRFKCRCSSGVARIFANLCCVPTGPKEFKNENEKTLARGFATSTRLALWCKLFAFQRIYWEAKKKLNGHDPKIAIFVDDIGITGSNVSREEMQKLSDRIEKILIGYGLPLNQEKKEKGIVSYLDKSMEHLGLGIGRNKIYFGEKTRRRQSEVTDQLKRDDLTLIEKKSLVRKNKAYKQGSSYIKKINKKAIDNI